MRSVERNVPHGADRVAPNLVRWGAVFAGTVISLAVFALLSSLWLALAYGEADLDGLLSGNLEWFLAGTAIFSLFLAGLLAGYLSGVRGAGSGLLNGLTAWGVLFVASLLTVVPGLTAITSNLGTAIGAGTNTIGGVVGPSGGGVTTESAVWATFWSLLIGAAVAALGGILGGAVKREVKLADTDVRGREEHDVYPTGTGTPTRVEPVATVRPATTTETTTVRPSSRD